MLTALTFTDLVAEVIDKYSHDYGDLVRLFYFCMDSKVNIQVCTDQDLVEMFAKHKASKCCLLTVAYHIPSSEPPVIPDWDSGSTVNSIEPPFTPSIACQSLAEPSHATHTQSAEPEYLTNPNPTNEHVGVDEKGLYIDLGLQYPHLFPILRAKVGVKNGKVRVLVLINPLRQTLMIWLKIESLNICLMLIITRKTILCQ